MRASSIVVAVVRVSWAIVILPASVVVAMAKPVCSASCSVRSLFTMPLMPDVPKSFWLNSNPLLDFLFCAFGFMVFVVFSFGF